MTAEHLRIKDLQSFPIPTPQWGPYLSERQWGTVREDYSSGGNAWQYFQFDHAHARAYQWGEDGIAGISDRFQNLCLSIAMWNGKDPILKERLFGLRNGEGNHGEDVKELYYYLDNVPSHFYMEYLYKYPQKAFPYEKLKEVNRHLSRAFQCISIAAIDPGFAKYQLLLIMREWYMKPDGQLPAYEWNFSDVNPPVHALASLQVYNIEKKNSGKGDFVFLKYLP